MRLAVIALLAGSVLGGAACNRASVRSEASEARPAAASSEPSRATAPAPANALAAAATTAPEPDTAAARGPEWREVTLPAGTQLPVVLETGVGSETSRVEQRVQAHLSRPIVVRGATVVPSGSEISGVVTDATRSGKVKGRAHVAVRFDTLVPRGSEGRYAIRTSEVGRLAPATKKQDALKIGGGAGGGALIGALVGGKKGALIGSAAGGGAGTAVVLSTRGKEAHIPRGSALTLRLTEPVTIRIRS